LEPGIVDSKAAVQRGNISWTRWIKSRMGEGMGPIEQSPLSGGPVAYTRLAERRSAELGGGLEVRFVSTPFGCQGFERSARDWVSNETL
jgi:hypothetical protein